MCLVSAPARVNFQIGVPSVGVLRGSESKTGRSARRKLVRPGTELLGAAVPGKWVSPTRAGPGWTEGGMCSELRNCRALFFTDISLSAM